MACDISGLCQAYTQNIPAEKPIDTAILVPWVKVWLYDQDIGGNAFVANAESGEIGVGNRSNPFPLVNARRNKAVIKSFQLGSSFGGGCRIEIIDEEGGDFRLFFDRLSKGNKVVNINLIKVVWGWVGQQCDGVPNVSKVSVPHTLLLKNANIDFSNGLFKFTLTGLDLVDWMQQTRDTSVNGVDNQPKFITEAIRDVMKQYDADVLFLMIPESGGKPEPMRFKNDRPSLNNDGKSFDAEQGYKAVYSCVGKTPLEAIRTWMDDCVDENGNGSIMYFDTTYTRRTLIFLSNYKGTCKPITAPNASRIVKTYIVNGGNCSNVISFKPYIDWAIAPTTVAVAGHSGTNYEAKKDPLDCLSLSNVIRGNNPNLVIDNSPLLYQIGRDANKFQASVNQANWFANDNIWMPVSAELRIQGDPFYSNPILWIARYIGIIVFNPYSIDTQGPNGCEWAISQPPCNSVLSNTNWRIEGVSHEIREGSYTTTFKLKLDTPGYDVNLPGTLGDVSDGDELDD